PSASAHRDGPGLQLFRQCIGPRCPRFRLSHAGSIQATLSRGPLLLPLAPSHPCKSWLFPPQTPERALAADSFANSSVPGPQLAVYAISYPTSDPLRDRSTANVKIRRRNVSGLISSQPISVTE